MLESLTNLIDPALLAKSRFLNRLNNCLRHELPVIVQAHFWVSGIEGNLIKVLTDNPHFVPSIKFHQSTLIECCNTAFAAELPERLEKLRISIIQPSETQEGDHRTKPGEAATIRLEEAARSVNDKPLSHALKRLAKRFKKI